MSSSVPKPNQSQSQSAAGTPKPATAKVAAPSSKLTTTATTKPGGAATAGSATNRGTRPPVTNARPTGSSTARPAAAAGPQLVKQAPKTKVRRAKLVVSKVDTWSVLKMSFLLSVALGIVTVVAVVVLWTLLDVTGVFGQINQLIGDTAGPDAGSSFDINKFASLGKVISFSVIIAVINVVLLTALSTLAALLYNISASLVGGIGVTLTDE